MVMSVDLKDSFNSTATSGVSGSSRSGEISGGSAFNIGGINLGTQVGNPGGSAGGGTPGTGNSLLGAALGDQTPLILIAAAAVAIILILRRK